ncbi:UNVERIFIED_CONTAM: hypothetical protein NCL1_48901 [Trichonephila clavipes]
MYLPFFNVPTRHESKVWIFEGDPLPTVVNAVKSSLLNLATWANTNKSVLCFLGLVAAFWAVLGKKLSSLFSPSTLHSMNGAVSWDPFGLAYVVFTGILDNGAIGGRIPIFDDIPLLQMTKFQKERFIDEQWLYNDEGSICELDRSYRFFLLLVKKRMIMTENKGSAIFLWSLPLPRGSMSSAVFHHLFIIFYSHNVVILRTFADILEQFINMYFFKKMLFSWLFEGSLVFLNLMYCID